MITDVDIRTKAEVLLEALPYFQRFSGTIFVVKLGGSFMECEEARTAVATDVAFLASVGIHVVVVHGGGKAISREMDAAGIEARFEKGLRVTDARTVEIVERVLNGELNLDLCERIQALKGRPIGVPGQSVLRCEKLLCNDEGEPVDLGFVGEVTYVDTYRLRKYLEEGYTPVVSPLARDKADQIYNTNADVAASHVASALNARRLVYLSDVPGLLRDPAKPESLISSLHVNDVEALIEDGTIGQGMRPKILSACQALANGVHRVHFIDGRVPHSLLLEIFTHKGVGTEIVQI